MDNMITKFHQNQRNCSRIIIFKIVAGFRTAFFATAIYRTNHRHYSQNQGLVFVGSFLINQVTKFDKFFFVEKMARDEKHNYQISA